MCPKTRWAPSSASPDQIIYPYLRGNVADVINRAGFPPVHLAEINFQAMYEQQQAQAADAPSSQLPQ